MLQSLVKLDLSETKIMDAGLKELFKASSLQTLDLGYTEVTDAGLKVLSTLKSLQAPVSHEHKRDGCRVERNGGIEISAFA